MNIIFSRTDIIVGTTADNFNFHFLGKKNTKKLPEKKQTTLSDEQFDSIDIELFFK